VEAGPLHSVAPWQERLELVGSVVPGSLWWNAQPLPPLQQKLSLPWLEGELRWEDEQGRHQIRLGTPEGLRPPEERCALLRSFAETLEKAELRLDDLTKIPNFAVTQLSLALRPLPLDGSLDTNLGAILEIFARPKSWLREEKEVQPVARVRRPAKEAVAHLMRHPEHATRLGLKIHPERILASLQEEELEIYENRAVVGLVRRLLERSQRRMAAAKDALLLIGMILEDFTNLQKFGQHQRLGRLRKEVSVELDKVQQEGQLYLEKLEQHRRLLQACMDSPLGLALRYCEPVRSPLRETNILTWDRRYAVLPEVWRAEEEEQKRRESPVDLVRDDPDRGYRAFCRMALLRALGEAGFRGTGTAGSRCEVERNSWSQESGRWQAGLWEEGAELVLELSWWAPNPPDPNKKAPRPKPAHHQRLVFRPTFGCVDAAEKGKIWLHPMTEGEGASWSKALHYRSLGSFGMAEGRAIPLAPWSFRSLDRLGRLIRIETLGWELRQDWVVSTCPSCGGKGREDKHGWNCDSCKGSWGQRTCDCGERVPKLLPPLIPKEDIEELVFDADTPAKRLAIAEGLAGRDLLAEWCSQRIGSFWMICPKCGRCNTSTGRCVEEHGHL
jgi:hypothetical protein